MTCAARVQVSSLDLHEASTLSTGHLHKVEGSDFVFWSFGKGRFLTHRSLLEYLRVRLRLLAPGLKNLALTTDHYHEVQGVDFTSAHLDSIHLNSALPRSAPAFVIYISRDIVSPCNKGMTLCHHSNISSSHTDLSQLSSADSCVAIDCIYFLSCTTYGAQIA